MSSLLILPLAVGCLLLLGAAIHDIMARTVPNELALAVALVGAALQLLQGTALIGVPAALLVFVLAALCWRRGWMGGGDVKLLGAASLLVPPGLVPTLVMAMALSGGVLALIYLLARHRMPVSHMPRPEPARATALLARAWRAERWRMRRGGPMPYAVAIASGAFFALFNGA